MTHELLIALCTECSVLNRAAILPKKIGYCLPHIVFLRAQRKRFLNRKPLSMFYDIHPWFLSNRSRYFGAGYVIESPNELGNCKGLLQTCKKLLAVSYKGSRSVNLKEQIFMIELCLSLNKRVSLIIIGRLNIR